MAEFHDKPICMEIIDKRYGRGKGADSTAIHQEYKRDCGKGFSVQTKKQIKYSVS
jgi:hypothetical protein